jgi:enoyl-CoA hydratase
LAAIMDALDSVELDPGVCAVVITGAGRAFSAGADIAAFQRHMNAGPAQAVAHFMRPGHRMTRRVESFFKPIIAAVNGLAFGGG